MFFTRHGERLDNIDPDWLKKTKCSPDDTPLADRGRIQAAELAIRMTNEPVQHIFCSPFQRCVETAHIIAQKINLSIKVEPGICEVLHQFPPGCMTLEELKVRFPAIDLDYNPTLIPDKQENHELDCFSRVKRTVRSIREKYSGNILFVGHAASVAGMTRAFVKTPHFVGLCTLTRIDPHPLKSGKWKTTFLADRSHLSDKRHLRSYKRMGPQLRRVVRVVTGR